MENFLEKTLNIAKQTYKNGNYPIGAFLLIDDKFEIEGQNQVVTENNHRLHAEIDIINKSQIYKGNVNKKILYVTMEPCNNCAKALVEFGIDEVYYILEDPSWGGKNILENAGIKTEQIKYKYDEYLNLIIEFMQKHGGYNEVLTQYISIKNNGENLYQKQLDLFIEKNFINISKELSDYKTRKIIYNNTLHYLKNAFLRTPEDKHQLVLNGYVADTNKLIKFIDENFINKDFEKLEISFIKGLHKNLFPEGFIAKSKDVNGKEFIQMIPGEFRKINLQSKTNPNKNIYLQFQSIEKNFEIFINNFNKTFFNIDDILLFASDFSRIHPFGDGNGRTLDILVDLLLLKNGLNPLFLGELKQNDEIGFYKILDKVYETRDVKLFYDFIENHKNN
ncbi:MAG: deaminase [Candidatus Gracilibacteria bacterium]|nr:deaminase [Candidatus Gracilibacteria bacterium]